MEHTKGRTKRHRSGARGKAERANQADRVIPRGRSAPTAIGRCRSYINSFWPDGLVGTREKVFLAQERFQPRIPRNSGSRRRNIRRSRWQFPTPQFQLRPANLFHTRSRCDANHASAPKPRGLANLENKRESAWSRRAPSDRHNHHPDRGSRREKTMRAPRARKEGQELEAW